MWASLICGASLAGCAVPMPVADRTLVPPPDRCDQTITVPDNSFTVASFNIHRGRGLDGMSDLLRTAGVVVGVDLAGMQEVSRGNLEDGLVDQTAVLADLLGHSTGLHFASFDRPIWDGGGRVGLAVTMNLPVINEGRFDLPELEGNGPRPLAWIEARIGNATVHFFDLHVTLTAEVTAEAQRPQIDAALDVINGICDLESDACILLGDLNTPEEGTIIPSLLTHFREAVMAAGFDVAAFTPRRDYIFVTQAVEVITACVVANDASDHPAVIAVLRVGN